MKNITLIKHHPCVQLGHLYEHLFLRQVNELFYKKRLFKSLDYAANGTTFEEGGIIVVDIELYSEEAGEQAAAVEQLRVDLGKDNENVTRALFQITAEESDRLHITDAHKLLDELLALDEQSWQSIDDLLYLNTSRSRSKYTPIYLSDQPQAKPRALRISTVANKSIDSQRAPLFNLVGRSLLLTITDIIAYKYGFYAGDLHGKASPLSVTSNLLVAQALAKEVNIDNIASLAHETAKYMLSTETIMRNCTDMLSTNYLLNPYLAPNFERILHETHVMIGTKGWQELATPEIIQYILDNLSLKIQFGRQHVVFAL